MNVHCLYQKNISYDGITVGYVMFCPETFQIKWKNISGQDMQHYVGYNTRWCTAINDCGGKRSFCVDTIEELREMYVSIKARSKMTLDMPQVGPHQLPDDDEVTCPTCQDVWECFCDGMHHLI